MIKRLLAVAVFMFPLACVNAQDDLPFDIEPITSFDEPWALTFLPDGRMLVTEKKGRLLIVTQDGEQSAVRGVPDVDYGGQGGLGDVALHPDFADNGIIYLSYAEAGVGGTRGAAVARGVLTFGERSSTLSDVEVIWRQYPKLVGFGHYGHRLLFDDEGYLWITSGDRQKFTPSQDMQANVGKMVRLHDDGSIPEDNPFVDYLSTDPLVDDEGVYGQIWSLGHRNPLGIAADLDGRIWSIEIPDHDTRPEFAAPAVSWVPAISPGDLMFVSGDLFTEWRGDALAAGLGSRAIVRIEIDGDSAREAERYEMGARIRSIDEGPDGALWVLEDERGSSQGRLLRLTPRD